MFSRKASCEVKRKASGDAVLVTGGNGFLGQHIVRTLHEHAGSEVREIRVFDVKPFEKALGMNARFGCRKVNVIYCVCCNRNRLREHEKHELDRW